MSNTYKFARACEIMDRFERDARKNLGGRDFALYGPWSCKREALEKVLFNACLSTPLVGIELDRAIEAFLMEYAHGLPRVVESARPTRRAPATALPDFADDLPNLVGSEPAEQTPAYAYNNSAVDEPHYDIVDRLRALDEFTE